MKLFVKILIGLVIVVAVVAGGGYATFKYRNRTPPQLIEPNYYEYYKTQDTVPEGNVALYISHLIMPEDFRMGDFYQLAQKSLQYIPWPAREMSNADRGVVLLDPERFYEFEPFSPTRLVDHYGNDVDVDGIPYAEKFQSGQVRWIPPSPRLHLDHGYFLLPGRKAGMSSRAAKLINKAKVYYYAPGKGFVDGRLPHESGNWDIVQKTLKKVRAQYGEIPYRWVSAEHFHLARQYMHELLDRGADTIVMAPPRPIYSHHEEFNGSIKHAMHYIHEWEEEHGKHIKVIITPQLGEFDILRQAYTTMLRDRLDTLPKGADVKIVVSVHGMAWDLVPHEAWIELAPPYRDRSVEDMRAVVAGYDFGRAEVVLSQDHFADPVNNPNGTYLSTNTAFWDGIRAGYDYVINLPIEFFAENTDTMFSHAMYNFEHFPGYEIYEPVDYSDWSKPYTRSFVVEDTEIIYNGLPVGRYNEPIVEAYFQAIDSVLSQASSQQTSAGVSQ